MARLLRMATIAAASAAAFAAGVTVRGAGPGALDAPRGAGETAAQARTYEVDRLWPLPLPKPWILGSVTGIAVDSSDRLWVVHRGRASFNARTEIGLASDPPTAELCCLPAPQVLAFDSGGALVRRWDGPGQGYDWPQSPGGIAVDAAGNVWISAAGAPAGGGRGGGGRGGRGGGGGGGAATPPAAPPQDAHILKFSADGKFLLQIGKPGNTGSATSTDALNRPAAVAVDSAANEVYVADTGNRRIVVFDARTGAHKRHWGAYGETPDPAATIAAYAPGAAAPRQFRNLTCVEVARDGMVYVCDRESNRIQVFQKDGKFVRETVIAPSTLGSGSVWDVALSNDNGQATLFVADGTNQKVRVLRRDTLAETGSFGSGGRWPGTFFALGSIAVDSRGAIYTGEALEGKRVQKFTAR
jgi:DNA-binding beta-propeller fold protein YncE